MRICEAINFPHSAEDDLTVHLQNITFLTFAAQNGFKEAISASHWGVDEYFRFSSGWVGRLQLYRRVAGGSVVAAIRPTRFAEYAVYRAQAAGLLQITWRWFSLSGVVLQLV